MARVKRRNEHREDRCRGETRFRDLARVGRDRRRKGRGIAKSDAEKRECAFAERKGSMTTRHDGDGGGGEKEKKD